MANFSLLTNLLREALTDPKKLQTNILKFQELFWHSEIEFPNNQIEEVLGDLAHDLDYYEANPRIHSEDASFFGEERALQEIRSALTLLDTEQA